MSKDIRHFVLETKDYGEFDVVEYKKYQKLENIIKEVRKILKEGLEQFDTRRREEIYAEQYFENALEILDKENK